ncbi:transcriptional regulator, AraC family [Flavobacterium tiangeerense]|uniref:Transcriptional regulator, AraC family n=1 Tax=Flavobacterium tiangeerense TaxID=459471 RepID=A0ABY3FKQ5_9FLAO|nr:helix-turn-helix transcriptional regulator [Flavobacterium tiangeerense]TWI00576.1 transcriptional regulator, AraC family [Flavobacterium tiangeerense]
MKKIEINSFKDLNPELKLKGFAAYSFESSSYVVRTYSRKDFYKICLNRGKNIIHYADRTFETNDTILFFGNPNIPYAWETISPTFSGCACLFSEDFFQISNRLDSLLQSSLFKIDGTPILVLNEEQDKIITTLFAKMIEEQESTYNHKDDMIRNYLQLIIHEALKMQPSENYSNSSNANSRIASVFLELLERQFPIETIDRTLKLKTPQDFASALSIHVNYLNRAVKNTTGKSTSTHISERIISEAKALLQHTDWNIADIAYALGFEYPSYFNNYFKKATNTNPKNFRSTEV